MLAPYRLFELDTLQLPTHFSVTVCFEIAKPISKFADCFGGPLPFVDILAAANSPRDQLCGHASVGRGEAEGLPREGRGKTQAVAGGGADQNGSFEAPSDLDGPF